MSLPPDSLYARGFAADARTLRALREGLAGRKAKMQRDRLPAALKTLAVEPAAKLVFVDLDGVADPEIATRELAAVCAVETAVIAIGSIDTAQFARALFQCGIADYLLKPVSALQIREACAALSADPAERAYAGRVVAFAGSAGSGTSTLVAAIARAIAADGRMASVVDLDPVAARLPGLLGIRPASGLSDLLESLGGRVPADAETAIASDQIDYVCTQADSGLTLVAYTPVAPPPRSPSSNAVCRLLAHLANRTHLVLVTGFPDGDMRLEIMQRADARVLQFEPTLSSLSAVVRSLALLGANCPVTLTQCLPRMPKSRLSPAHVRYALGDRRPDVVIPFDPAIHAIATGTKSRRTSAAYRKSIREVLRRVLQDLAAAPAD